MRQITDAQRMGLLSRCFTPWGELLDQTGNGVLGAATGLIYVGNGQYYEQKLHAPFTTILVHPLHVTLL